MEDAVKTKGSRDDDADEFKPLSGGSFKPEQQSRFVAGSEPESSAVPGHGHPRVAGCGLASARWICFARVAPHRGRFFEKLAFRSGFALVTLHVVIQNSKQKFAGAVARCIF